MTGPNNDLEVGDLEASSRGLLLASISERNGRGLGPLPHLRVGLHHVGLFRVGSALQTGRLSSKGSGTHLDLSHAGAEIQRVAAFLGGVLLARAAQVGRGLAHHAASSRRGVDLPFHQSFKLPWDRRRHDTRQ
jgi:hypothetical protein